VLIPIGDEPHEPGTAWVNHGLIAANVLVMILVGGWQETPEFVKVIKRWGYLPSEPRVDTLFSSLFLHGGMLHLFGNMLFLWIFGDNVEARLGHARYLVAYLATGAAATLTYGAVHPDGTQHLIGASGAISGVQGMYFLGFPKNRVRVLVFFIFILQVVHVPARWIIGFWFVVNDLIPMLTGRHISDNVAHAAHLGGFAAGIATYLLLKPWLREAERRAAGIATGGATFFAGTGARGWGKSADPYAGGRTRPPPDWGTAPPPGLAPEEAILALWQGGRFTEAAQVLADRLRTGRPPSLPETEYFRLCVYLYERGQFDDARRAFHAFLAAHPRSRNAPAASFALGMIYARRDHDPAHARPFLEQALRAHPDPAVREQARQEIENLRR
jgi:membrane associated rhomboid family serine protease